MKHQESGKKKKKKSKREVGAFQGSRTSSNLSKEKCWEERVPRLDEEECVSLPRTCSDTCTVLMPMLSVQAGMLVCLVAGIFLRLISNHLPAFFSRKGEVQKAPYDSSMHLVFSTTQLFLGQLLP